MARRHEFELNRRQKALRLVISMHQKELKRLEKKEAFLKKALGDLPEDEVISFLGDIPKRIKNGKAKLAELKRSSKEIEYKIKLRDLKRSRKGA